MSKQRRLIVLVIMALSYPLIIDNLFLSSDINHVVIALVALPAVIALMWIVSRSIEQMRTNGNDSI